MKGGIEYFPLDNVLDTKWELIEAQFGIKGFGVIVKLYQEIYGKEGYYIELKDEIVLLFAKKINVDCNIVSDIIQASIKREMFHKGLFEKYQILTSNGIQKRYLEIVKRRKSATLIKEYLLVSANTLPKNVYIKSKNVYISSENVDILEQRKGKERKGKREGELSLSESKFKTAFPNKEIDIDIDDEKINIDLLIKKINESNFLTSCNNCQKLSWFLKEENYKKVISDKYKDFKLNQNGNIVFNGREYTSDQLNGLFDKIDEIEI